jgi:hypothetical protein
MFNVNLIQCEENLQKQKNTPMLFQTLIIMALFFCYILKICVILLINLLICKWKYINKMTNENGQE